MIQTLVTTERILYKDRIDDWQTALWHGAKPLLDDNTITPSYIETVISTVQKEGPYIVIAPQIAISHARPENGVHQLGMTILLLGSPVYFNNQADKPVRLIITLASPTNEIHLQALKHISTFLLQHQDRVLSSTNKQGLQTLIEEMND